MDLAAIVIDALRLALTLSAPALGACVLISVLMSVVQTATQANDASLGFVPKLLAVSFALFLSRDYLAQQLVGFSSRVLHDMAQLGN